MNTSTYVLCVIVLTNQGMAGKPKVLILYKLMVAQKWPNSRRSTGATDVVIDRELKPRPFRFAPCDLI